MTDWMTRNDCKRFVLGRWGHFPPFAIISTIKLIEKFARRYCP